MMRVICLLLVSVIAIQLNAQQYTKFNGYGFQADRLKADSISIHPSDTVRNKAARSIAVLNGVFYIADGTKWKVVGTDTTSLSNRIDARVKYTDTALMLSPYLRKADTTSLSNRINLKLNISDTINKWVTNVYKVNDSTIAVLKNGVVSNIVINPDAKRLVTNVYNNTGVTIPKGSVVYINGRHSSNLPTVALAQANNEDNSYKTFALVQDDILTSSSGIAIQAGKIENLNLPTSTYTDGDILYLSPTVPGGYTLVKPLAPFHICKLGSVTRAHPTFGSIEIKIENGWQLDELSDVSIAAVPLDSTILQFSRVDSLWHDVNPTTAMGNRFVRRTDSAAMLSPYIRNAGFGLTKSSQLLLADSLVLSTRAWRQKGLDSLAAIKQNNLTLTTSGTSGPSTLVGSTLNIPQYQGVLTNPITGTGVGTSSGGRVPYFTGTTTQVGSDNLWWDNTNARLGILTTSPSFNLDVNGTARVQGTTTITGSTTASGAIARGANLTPTLVAAANNDVLVGLDINPTFTNGAFTGLTNSGIRVQGGASNISPSLYVRQTSNTSPTWFAVRNTDNNAGAGAISADLGISGGSNQFFNGTAQGDVVFKAYSAGNTSKFFIGATSGTTPQIVLFPATGNTSINSTTDAGFRLDVNGTARVQGVLTIPTSNWINTDWIRNQQTATTTLTSANMSNSGGNSFQFRTGGTYTALGANVNEIDISAMTVGIQSTSTFNHINIANNLDLNANVTTASIVRGVYYNPTITNLRVAQHRAIETVRGDVILGSTSGSVGIGANTSINASAILDVTSTTQGFLPPRMTTAQRDLIATPAAGLVIYNTSTNKHQGYNGTTWNDFY